MKSYSFPTGRREGRGQNRQNSSRVRVFGRFVKKSKDKKKKMTEQIARSVVITTIHRCGFDSRTVSAGPPFLASVSRRGPDGRRQEQQHRQDDRVAHRVGTDIRMSLSCRHNRYARDGAALRRGRRRPVTRFPPPLPPRRLRSLRLPYDDR